MSLWMFSIDLEQEEQIKEIAKNTEGVRNLGEIEVENWSYGICRFSYLCGWRSSRKKDMI